MSGDQVGIVVVGLGMTAGCCLMLWRALRLPKPPECICPECQPVKPTPAPKFGELPPDYDA